MKIASIESIPLRIPFHHRPFGEPGSFILFGGPWTHMDTMLVKVETDTGIVGWGEAFAFRCTGAIKFIIDQILAPMVLGRDATDISRMMHELQVSLHGLGRDFPTFALSGLDIALWDIAGKAADMPLHRLLGANKPPKRLAAYQSVWFSEDREKVAEVVRSSVKEGFRMIKLHSITEPTVRAAREAAGSDIMFMVDVNCRWTMNQALAEIPKLRQYGIDWLEEPVYPPDCYATLAELQRATGVAVASGENACTAFEFDTMFRQRAVRVANPAVPVCGGVTEFRKIAALCDVHGVDLRPHCTAFGPGFLVNLQMEAAQPRPGPIERFQIYPETFLYGDLLKPVDASFEVPAGPGLGRDPDPNVIREYRVK